MDERITSGSVRLFTEMKGSYINIGNMTNYLAAVILFIFGVIYLFRPSFMAYHREALDIEWEMLEHSMQVLVLALMRAVSGGFIATSLAIAVLQNRFGSSRIAWLPSLILTIGLIVSAAILYATLMIRINTPGQPPTGLAILGVALLVTGFIFNRKAVKKS